MADNEGKKPQVKRKPGRPRSKPEKKPPARLGIQENPENEDNIIEMKYCAALIIKKLGVFGKNLKSEVIKFVFEPDGVYILLSSFIDRDKAKIFIDGSKLHSYYCKEPKTIYLNFKNWEFVLQKIDKDCEEFIICVNKDNLNRKIDIILRNNFEMPLYYEVDVVQEEPDMKVKMEDFSMLSEENYDLIFRIPSAALKKIFGTEKNIHNEWKIEKDGIDGDVVFGFNSKNKQVKARQIPTKNKKVEIIKNIENDRMFLITFRLSDIKPVTDTQLTDFMTIKASDNNHPIWVTSSLDDECVTVDIAIGVEDSKNKVTE